MCWSGIIEKREEERQKHVRIKPLLNKNVVL